MPLIVEDGTGLEDANSFVSLEDAKALATMRGILLSSDDNELTQQLINAADRIVSCESKFTGSRVNGEQGLSYPRKNSFRYGSTLADNLVPKELKLAQITLAGLQEGGTVIWGAAPTGIKSETVGPLETVYTDGGADSVGNPELPQIDSILQPLFAPFSANFTLSR